VLFTVCAYWLVPAVWWCLLHCCILHCLSDPSCWKKVSGGPELGVVIVRLVAGRGIGRGWVVGIILWLLEF